MRSAEVRRAFQTIKFESSRELSGGEAWQRIHDVLSGFLHADKRYTPSLEYVSAQYMYD